jgi:Tfp pilus assembly protein PilO
VTLTDRDRKLLLALVPLALLAFYWFILLAPKREAASAASEELATQEQRLDAARTNLAAAQGAKQGFDASYARIVRLGKAIPSTVDMPSLIVQLDAAAAGTGIRFTKIATGDRLADPAAAPAATTTPPAESSTPAAAGGETAQSAPGAAAESANNAQQTADQRNAAAEQSGVPGADTQTSTPAGDGTSTTGAATAPPPVGLETVPLELEFVGNFFNLADFFHDVKRFVSMTNQDVLVSGRLLTVESVRWASDAEIFPKLKAEVKATIYLSPKAQGATAGATPQGPATAAPGEPVPAESTPAAPSATVTP